MLSVNTLAGVVQPPPLVSVTLDWMRRCAKIDGWGFLVPLNNLIRAGIAHGWLNDESELMCLGAGTQQASLEGIMGVIRSEDVTVHGDVSFVPRYGAVRNDLSENSYIDLGSTLEEFPGVEVNSHTLAIYTTTNYVGNYTEAGTTGTAGKTSLMIRAGSGFRSGAWSAASQTIFGTGAAWGLTAFSRTAETTLSLWKQQIGSVAATAAVAPLSTSPVTLLAAEPSVGNSPNQLLLFHLGRGLTDQQGNYRAADFIQFVRELGILADIEVPDVVLGPNCFGPSALASVLPTNRRVARQLPFPATNSTPATSSNAYPITDSIVRSYTRRDTSTTLAADPVTTASGSGVLTIAYAAHPLKVDDVVDLTGLAGFNGLSSSDINRRYIVTTVVDADHFQVETPATATGDGAGGGSSGHISCTVLGSPITSFVPPRSGRLWHLTWVNRGERDTVDGPITSRILKGNDSYGMITRRTTQVEPLIIASVQDRPVYTTKTMGLWATLAHIADQLGYLMRDEPRDPLRQGVLDIAEAAGLDADKVKRWQHFYVHADDIFTVVGSNGYAVAYDWVILAAKRLIDVPGFDVSRLGICLDDEPACNIPPDLRSAFMARLSQIVGAVGVKWMAVGHDMAGSRATRNGWTRDNAHLALADPNCDGYAIVAAHGEPGGIVSWLDEQAATFGGPEDAPVAIDYSKIWVSCTTGPGKNRIDDEGPLSPSQPSLEECDAVAAWMTEKGILHTHIRRGGMVEGGEIERVPNQQMMRYLPTLGATPEQTGVALAQAWEQQVVFNGGTVSAARLGTVTAWLSALIDAGIWAKLDLCLLLKGENAASQLTDMKHYALAVVHGAPTVVVDGYYEFDGVDDYVDHGWAPSSATAMTGSNLMLAVDVINEAEGAAKAASGCFNSGSQGLRLNPITDDTDNPPDMTIQGMACFAHGAASTIVTGGFARTGLFGIQKAPTNVGSYWLDGAALATPTVSSPTTSLPTRSLYTGCLNSNGTANSFKAGKRTLVLAGQSLNSTEWAALAAAKAALFAAIDSGG